LLEEKAVVDKEDQPAGDLKRVSFTIKIDSQFKERIGIETKAGIEERRRLQGGIPSRFSGRKIYVEELEQVTEGLQADPTPAQ
jgi:hypothetical protein